jgi:hypothetical protein
VESLGKESSSLLLQFPAGKSLFNVNWLGVLSKEKKVSKCPLLIGQRAGKPASSLANFGVRVGKTVSLLANAFYVTR